LSATEELSTRLVAVSESADQIAKRGAELKRDQEFTMLNGAVAAAGNTTTARGTASLQAFIRLTTICRTDGANPSYTILLNSARTDGNVRTFTETILK